MIAVREKTMHNPLVTNNAHILIVDDDPHIRDVVRIAAEAQGLRTTEAADGRRGLTEYARGGADLIVLDVGMPHMDGYEVCRELRRTSAVPVIFLTARADEIDRVLGFELGADDFVSKPFSPRELMLRIRAVLSRGKQTVTARLTHGALSLDPSKHRATLDEAELTLTGTEFSILAALLRHPGQVFDRNQLIAAVYGNNPQLSGRTLDSHIRNIRAKGAEAGCADLIETLHGIGIRLGTCTLG